MTSRPTRSRILGTLAWIAVVSSFTSTAQAQSPRNNPADWGPEPQLVAPHSSWIPTVNIAHAKPWPEDSDQPMAAEGMTVNAFARGLEHPRWLYALPNGDILVAQSNTPADSGIGGLLGFVMRTVMGWAGAGGKSPDRITLLRDSDGDGIADTQSTFLDNLHSPFGMALIGNTLYVANTDAVVAFDYQEGATQIDSAGEKVVDLPAGKINHHWTKNILASRDGSKLYASVGSNSNVGENGMDVEKDRARILEIDLATKSITPYATGIRNPNGMDWEPTTGALWVAVNERDEIGDLVVPDYMTSVRPGAFYGWPYSYFGQHIDDRIAAPDDQLVASAIKPDYALGAHTASLGLTFTTANALPARFSSGAFIGQHGSWNRSQLVGYEVVFIPFTDGMPDGEALPVLSGFITDGGDARGRPVGVIMDHSGNLLVADDVGNTIWRVSASK